MDGKRMSPQSTGNVIAIVGRPNVGKSSLFNRILGKRVAIVEKHSGTTRDRLREKTTWKDVPFELVDTGGIVTDPKEELARLVKFQAEVAISEASVILFVVDVSEGLTPLDIEIAGILRKAGQKKVIVVVNKCDSVARMESAPEFYSLGFEKVIGASAVHGLGINYLLDEAVAGLPGETGEEREAALRIAVIGQPNVGKSTFINFILGEDRLIVHDTPGTTRDSIDVLCETEDGEKIIFIDTAGIRRKRSMSRPIEKLGSLRAERSIGNCDVAVLMLDATKGPTTGDARIAHIVQEEHKGCVLVTNKWDLVEQTPQEEAAESVYEKLPFLSHCPIVFTVATMGKGVVRTLQAAREVHRESMTRIPTPVLNDLLREALQDQPPPLVRSANIAARKGAPPARPRRLKIYYATQTGVAPPQFRLFANNADLATKTYVSYLTNRIRSSFPFPGSPILLSLRSRT